MSFGIYVHVPFCRSICPYCAFNVVRAKQAIPAQALWDAVCAEAHAHAPLFDGPLRTVYIGGGTPSLMSPQWIATLIATLRERFGARHLQEVTLEVEPGTLDEAGLRAVRRGGVTRLSIGWQSSVPRLLQALGRGHSHADAARLLADAQAAGFDNISLDWMLAGPGQSQEEFARDASAIVAAAPSHVSCYVLSVEPKTPFARQQAKGTLKLPGEEAEVQWLTQAAQTLRRAGYRRYEVASFARPGAQSRHNRAYWSGRPYLGLGPGAHSFARRDWQTAQRWQSTAKLGAYLAAWRPGAPAGRPSLPTAQACDFIESIDASAMAFERMMLGLRRVCGISLRAQVFASLQAQTEALAHTLLRRRWASRRGTRLRPTPLGLLHADAAAALFSI